MTNSQLKSLFDSINKQPAHQIKIFQLKSLAHAQKANSFDLVTQKRYPLLQIPIFQSKYG